MKKRRQSCWPEILTKIYLKRYASRSAFLRGGLSDADCKACTEPPEMLRALPAYGEVCCLNTLRIQAWMVIRRWVSLTELPCPGSWKSNQLDVMMPAM